MLYVFLTVRTDDWLALHRFYVRKACKPKERVAVALAVKIGSAVEEDHEQVHFALIIPASCT